MKKFLHSFVEPQTLTLWLTYWMYALLIFAPVALVINFVKVRHYRKFCINGHLDFVENGVPAGIFASHHDWLVRSFVILVFASMAAAGTFYYGFGILVAVVVVPYWFYRLGKGMVSLAAHKPMPGFYC